MLPICLQPSNCPKAYSSPPQTILELPKILQNGLENYIPLLKANLLNHTCPLFCLIVCLCPTQLSNHCHHLLFPASVAGYSWHPHDHDTSCLHNILLLLLLFPHCTSPSHPPQVTWAVVSDSTQRQDGCSALVSWPALL